MQPVDKYIEKAKVSKKLSNRIKQIMPALSLVVMASVFWTLKLTGITMAGEAFCGQTEHVHDENCGSPPIICQLVETEEHYHTDSCITQHLICTTEETEGHAHGDECYSSALICTTEETDGHTHDEQCSTEEIVCELAETESHHHAEECYTLQLICTSEETDGHTHSDECYTIGTGFVCQQVQTEEQTQPEEHLHTAECVGEETELCCGKEFCPPHTHNESCYGPAEECLLEEHIHTSECYSDINADLETQSQWEETIAGIVPNARPQDNIVAVAYSQLGYTESEKNFEVDENGNKNGYTRYGQWYGNPYGQWNTMFASFCLHYSQLEGIPLSAGADTMRIEWESLGIYVSAESWQPSAGDLIFLDKNANGAADAVAIVTGFNEGQISVIEGDLENKVAETVYSADDTAVMGYGVIPDMSGIMTLEERALTTVAYRQNYTGQNLNNEYFLLYTQSGNNYYAIDGNANAVQIFIDNAGNISADVNNINTLLWRFESASNYDNRPAYYIRNVATGKYLHPYQDSNTSRGAILDGRWESALYSNNNGFRVRGARQDAYLQLQNNRSFTNTGNLNNGSVMYLGRTPTTYTVWLDGTQGGLGYLTGSPNTPYAVTEGGTMQLPTNWTSSDKYDYKLRGWYDITNGRYYKPGDIITVTGNTVIYADWVAATYDIGIFNAQVADTVSTNSFITTHMFDYNYLLNIHSSRASITANASGHSETWSMVTSGNVLHGNKPTLDFVFIDNDSGGKLCIPDNRSSHNVYPGAGIVTPGIYSDAIGELLFSTENIYNPDTGEGVIGKTYLGTGDHLFQIMTNQNDEHYGYYYYDSQLNAASYNQSNSRFYVYEYLSGTSDAIGSTYSDFLPLNAPYANTNGQTVGTYTYNGVNGEYNGVTHYRYDSKYDSGNYNSADAVQTDYAYGMRSDVRFYLPNEPGSGGNKDLNGRDMQFKFSGDDDLWVLIDGKLVLDIGGIHGAEDGTIDFSTGEITVQGVRQKSLMELGITAGDHTMSILYLERGSSMSNCSIYFNLAPRFALEIKKEDVLSQELLNGAQFTVYEDFNCTKPAELWESEDAYLADIADGALDSAQSTFTVTNGTAKIWGLGSGNTYYIKETKPPDKQGYPLAQGLIRLTIERDGLATYYVDVISDAEGNGPSNGFTVHGVTIDDTTQTAYITATNAQDWVQETTTVQAVKFWEDDLDHSDDYVTVYLTITDADGTVRRIREMILSEENDWSYIWTNLPKQDAEGKEIVYGVAESYEEGYYSTSTRVDKIIVDKSIWVEAASFANGEEYLLKTANGYLATQSTNSASLMWVDEATAQRSPAALWTAIANGSNVKLTNGLGYTLTFQYSNGQYFYASTGSSSTQTFTAVDSGGGIKLYVSYKSNNNSRAKSYYIYYMNNNGTLASNTDQKNGMVFTPMTYIEDIEEIQVKDWGYQIVNTPLEEETSLTVTKQWDAPAVDVTKYQEKQITVKLLANGTATGRTVTLTLKNNWKDTFRGLPYRDNDGNVIVYTVEEVFSESGWSVSYGEINTHSGDPPTYSTTITNTYHPGGPMLPSTGSFARLAYIYCGGGMMLASLITAIRLRRKKERRNK